jgi:hypothetical protein
VNYGNLILWVIRLKNHFESIQRISDITTLPYAMHELRTQILEQLDLSELRDQLMQGKGQPGMLSPQQRIELWGRLKILSEPLLLFSCYLWIRANLLLYLLPQVKNLAVKEPRQRFQEREAQFSDLLNAPILQPTTRA